MAALIRNGARRSSRRDGRPPGLQPLWWSRSRFGFLGRWCRRRLVFCPARLVELGGGGVTSRLPHHALVWSGPLASTARVLQAGNTSQSSSGYGWPPEISCFSPSPSRLRTRSFLATVASSVSESVFSSPSELSTTERVFVLPTSRTGVGTRGAPPAGLLRRSHVVLGCSSCSGTSRLPRRPRRPRRAPVFSRPQNWGTVRLVFCLFLGLFSLWHYLEEGQIREGWILASFCNCPDWPFQTFLLLLCLRISICWRRRIAVILAPVSCILFVCRCSQISRQWPCPMQCRWTAHVDFSPISFSQQLSHFSRSHWRKARVPFQEMSHEVSRLGFESWRLSPGDLFEPSFHHDDFSLSPPLSTGWSTSCHGCMRDHEFDWADRRHWFHWESNVPWPKDQGQSRDWQVYEYKSAPRSCEISVFQNWGLQPYCPQAPHTLFETVVEYSRGFHPRVLELYFPRQWCSRFGVATDPMRHQSNQVNQVTTRVKSKSMLIKESRACSRIGIYGIALVHWSAQYSRRQVFFQTNTETFLARTCRHNGWTPITCPAANDCRQKTDEGLHFVPGTWPQSRRVIVIRLNDLLRGTLSTSRLSWGTKVICPKSTSHVFRAEPDNAAPNEDPASIATNALEPHSPTCCADQCESQARSPCMSEQSLHVCPNLASFWRLHRHHQVFINMHTWRSQDTHIIDIHMEEVLWGMTWRLCIIVLIKGTRNHWQCKSIWSGWSARAYWRFLGGKTRERYTTTDYRCEGQQPAFLAPHLESAWWRQKVWAVLRSPWKTMTWTLGNCRDWQVCTWVRLMWKMLSTDSRSQNCTAPFCPSWSGRSGSGSPSGWTRVPLFQQPGVNFSVRQQSKRQCGPHLVLVKQGFVHVESNPQTLFHLRNFLPASQHALHAIFEVFTCLTRHNCLNAERSRCGRWHRDFWHNENLPSRVHRYVCHTRHGRAAASEKPLAVLGSRTSGVIDQPRAVTRSCLSVGAGSDAKSTLDPEHQLRLEIRTFGVLLASLVT